MTMSSNSKKIRIAAALVTAAACYGVFQAPELLKHQLLQRLNRETGLIWRVDHIGINNPAKPTLHFYGISARYSNAIVFLEKADLDLVFDWSELSQWSLTPSRASLRHPRISLTQLADGNKETTPLPKRISMACLPKTGSIEDADLQLPGYSARRVQLNWHTETKDRVIVQLKSPIDDLKGSAIVRPNQVTIRLSAAELHEKNFFIERPQLSLDLDLEKQRAQGKLSGHRLVLRAAQNVPAYVEANLPVIATSLSLVKDSIIANWHIKAIGLDVKARTTLKSRAGAILTDASFSSGPISREQLFRISPWLSKLGEGGLVERIKDGSFTLEHGSWQGRLQQGVWRQNYQLSIKADETELQSYPGLPDFTDLNGTIVVSPDGIFLNDIKGTFAGAELEAGAHSPDFFNFLFQASVDVTPELFSQMTKFWGVDQLQQLSGKGLLQLAGNGNSSSYHVELNLDGDNCAIAGPFGLQKQTATPLKITAGLHQHQDGSIDLGHGSISTNNSTIALRGSRSVSGQLLFQFTGADMRASELIQLKPDFSQKLGGTVDWHGNYQDTDSGANWQWQLATHDLAPLDPAGQPLAKVTSNLTLDNKGNLAGTALLSGIKAVPVELPAASFQIKGNLTKEPKRFDWEGIRIAFADGSVTAAGNLLWDKDNLNSTTRVALHDLSIEELQRIFKKDINMSGRLDGDITVDSNKDKLITAGEFNLAAHDGSITKQTLLAQLLTLTNLPQLLQLKVPDLARDGIPYDDLLATGHIRGDSVDVRSFVMEGSALRATGSASITGSEHKLAGKVSVQPFTTVDLVLGNIPVLGWLALGDKESLLEGTIRLAGTMERPELHSAITSDIWRKGRGIIKRTVTAPFQIVPRLTDVLRKLLGVKAGTGGQKEATPLPVDPGVRR